LRGGEIIELVSDLGGGKTTFVRGLARGMGSKDNVASPTFTISRQYKAKGLTLHHFDFYRLPEPGLIAHELAEVLEDPKAITVIEWAGIVQDVLPTERITIHIKSTEDEGREFTIIYPETFAYVLKGLQDS
jgi:tRNA threonylcarbamoyladenosine biosynthesis protein TsaE